MTLRCEWPELSRGVDGFVDKMEWTLFTSIKRVLLLPNQLI